MLLVVIYQFLSKLKKRMIRVIQAHGEKIKVWTWAPPILFLIGVLIHEILFDKFAWTRVISMTLLTYVGAPTVLFGIIIYGFYKVIKTEKNFIFTFFIYIFYFVISGILSVAGMLTAYEYVFIREWNSIFISEVVIIPCIILIPILYAILHLTIMPIKRAQLLVSVIKAVFAIIYSVLGVVLAVLALPITEESNPIIKIQEEMNFIIYTVIFLSPYLLVKVTSIFLEILEYCREQNERDQLFH